MGDQTIKKSATYVTFGRRKVVPRVCIASGKQHIRDFLGEALEELGFIVCECAQISELSSVFDARLPDLVVLDLSSRETEGGEIVKTLATKEFDGKVLLLGRRDSRVVVAVRELGEQLGIEMLPTLATPFGDRDLFSSVATLLPFEAPPNPPVDAAEALSRGWLELWYQPKIDTRTLGLNGAEAVIRMRHPTWGIVQPAHFLPDDGDPHLCAISEFVISQAIADWRYFVAQHYGIEIAINMPASSFQDPNMVRGLCKHLPDHSAFAGLIIEIGSTGVVTNLELAQHIARQLRFYNIGISIDDVGVEWPRLAGLPVFPFVEIKVDRQFVAGCANDRLKRTICRQILDLADGYGTRSVAEGVETQADFLAVREMGFDIAQGFLFGKPMPAKKFARTMLRRPVSPMPG